jgi:hypothetical protein
MEGQIKTPQTTESKPEIEVVFDCSIESEINRVKNTLKTLDWYKETGYKLEFIGLPKSIQQKVEKGEEITDDNIAEAVKEEFDPDVNSEKIASIEQWWSQIEEKFFENLRTLGLPVQEKYIVSVTKYGSGGSYWRPNSVKLNIKSKRGSLVLPHEIVHLTIEHLIQEYKIDHWTKERLVDLIMNKFFPEDQKLQRDPKNAEQISEIFERDFPNIKKIISDISQLKNESDE